MPLAVHCSTDGFHVTVAILDEVEQKDFKSPTIVCPSNLSSTLLCFDSLRVVANWWTEYCAPHSKAWFNLLCLFFEALVFFNWRTYSFVAFYWNDKIQGFQTIVFHEYNFLFRNLLYVRQFRMAITMNDFHYVFNSLLKRTYTNHLNRSVSV